MERNKNLKNGGQVTIFIIIAIVIVVAVVAYFALRKPYQTQLSKDMQPVYDYYLSCLERTSREGIALLGEQGGWIEAPDFIPGSQYMPFSSQLDFFGQPVPYWMYVSGNNLLKEQVPTKNNMKEQLGNYISERLKDCDFSLFNMQGYDVFVDEGEVDAVIKENNINIKIINALGIVFENQSVIINNHELNLDSKLGKFYDLAKNVYDYEKENMFLETYALDVMRLYAPVTGVELTCAPKIFIDENIKQDLIQALTANINALKLKGDYYALNDKEKEYFVTNIGENINENVNFIYSSKWPARIEIYGDKIVEPVGLQEGLGILGFCYVPYQLIYDIDFPVLIQFYDNNEVFQFPVAVVINKNQAREALPSLEGVSIESSVCDYKNQDVLVSTYDLNLNPVEASIKFKCLNSECNIGSTKIQGGEAVLNAKMPQCVNGFVIASASGYINGKYQISTNEEGIANVIMKKKYNVSLDLGNVEKAFVNFKGSDYSASVAYPEMKTIELAEDYYNVSVYVYKNSSLTIPASSTRKCVDVPSSGIGGIFGAEEEKCFNIDLPATEIPLVLVGGGRTQEYITEGQLKNQRELNVNVLLFKTPVNLEEVQDNYLELDDSVIYLEFE